MRTGVLHQITVLHTKFFVTCGSNCSSKKSPININYWTEFDSAMLFFIVFWWGWCVWKKSLGNFAILGLFGLFFRISFFFNFRFFYIYEFLTIYNIHSKDYVKTFNFTTFWILLRLFEQFFQIACLWKFLCKWMKKELGSHFGAFSQFLFFF